MDPDPDPAIFGIDLQDASKKLIFYTNSSAYYFLKLHLHHFSKIKSQKESQNSMNQGFSYYLCMMIEESGLQELLLNSFYVLLVAPLSFNPDFAIKVIQQYVKSLLISNRPFPSL